MRLLTQNMLVCNVRACAETSQRDGGCLSFPLVVRATQTELRATDFSAPRVLALLPKLDWAALRATAAAMGVADLPAAAPAAPEKDEAFLRSVHTLVLDVHVLEGALVCPHCGRAYPIAAGIPNMLLAEDEI